MTTPSPETVERVWLGSSILGRLRREKDRDEADRLRAAGYREVSREPIPGSLEGPDRAWRYTLAYMASEEREVKDRHDQTLGWLGLAMGLPVVVGILWMLGLLMQWFIYG